MTDIDELFYHCRHTLEELGKQKGMLGLSFNKSQNKFQYLAKRRLIVNLIDRGIRASMSANVKSDTYEGLLEKSPKPASPAPVSTSLRARQLRTPCSP